jgi:hypothetical protein
MAETSREAPSSPHTEEVFYKILVVLDPSRRKTRRDIEDQVDWVEIDLLSELVDKILQCNGCRDFVYQSSGDDVGAGFSRVWIHEFVSVNGSTALKSAFITNCINKPGHGRVSMVSGPQNPTCAGYF